MKLKKNFVIVIVIITISSIFLMKNSKFLEKDNSYVVSEVEGEEYKSENNNNLQQNDSKKETFSKVNNMEDVKTIKNSENVSKKISIYISGAVNSPGVVELKSNDRLMEGVKLCNGLTEEADTNRINLAMKVKDEGHYIIPKVGEEIMINESDVETENKNEDTSSEANEKNKININSASMEELDSLPGIGEVTAQKILDYREENKEFKSIDEIKNVKGIGENKFNDLKDYICIQ
ncbi:helix-hairpin-helix domain-containing protein [Paraclostridium ghonii]|uniref:Competence protein ComEA n=1 Tax=Paraclostridium ghonii TaxID=29358 RepID=A0ABU0N122_9FIRM|nr:helix-hairpin-helix domain-containing protein [Paeniclostridium ghonii]MDQ0556811.1 competence protein ComEA [Paeniclostridium ghonii]